jgi:hypothetical protein
MRPASARSTPVVRAAVAAVLVAILAFVFRFNTLGGALGGFDNDQFIYLVRTDMILDGAQPLRDFVDAELRGAWPALTYEVSAWAQQIGGRTLRSEAYLTVGLLALAHATVFLLALRLSRRVWVALLAALVAIATMPKLYNYPKVLALTLGVWSLCALVARPSLVRLALAALITAAAVLFRHDLGIYVAAAVGVGLIVREGAAVGAAAKHVAIYAAMTAVLLLPSVLWVQRYEGVLQYLRDASESVAVERSRTNLRLPPLDFSTPLTLANVEVVSYYAFWGVPAVAAGIVLARAATGRMPREELAVGAGLIAMATLANMSFLRANLAERFGDAAPAMALLAAWIAGAGSAWSSAAARRATAGVAAAVLLVAAGAGWVYADLGRELATSGLIESARSTVRRYAHVHDELGSVPPIDWANADAGGTLRAARYVAECTRPSDRLLTLGPLHEIPVYARRRFAAGQAMFKLSLYTSEAFQRRALTRLQAESVPIVIADADEFGEFEDLYPLVARQLARQYRDAGVIEIDGDPRIRVFVALDRAPVRTHPDVHLPCFV